MTYRPLARIEQTFVRSHECSPHHRQINRPVIVNERADVKCVSVVCVLSLHPSHFCPVSLLYVSCLAISCRNNKWLAFTWTRSEQVNSVSRDKSCDVCVHTATVLKYFCCCWLFLEMRCGVRWITTNCNCCYHAYFWWWVFRHHLATWLEEDIQVTLNDLHSIPMLLLHCITPPARRQIEKNQQQQQQPALAFNWDTG